MLIQQYTKKVYGGVFMAARVAFMLLIFLVNQYVLQRTKEQEMVQQYRVLLCFFCLQVNICTVVIQV